MSFEHRVHELNRIELELDTISTQLDLITFLAGQLRIFIWDDVRVSLTPLGVVHVFESMLVVIECDGNVSKDKWATDIRRNP